MLLGPVMLPLALTALSLAAAELTPPPPPPDVEPLPQAQEAQPQGPARPAPRVFLYTAPLKLLFMDLNAEVEVHVNEDVALFAEGGVNALGWDWQAGARGYLPPLQGAGPWRAFVDGHVSQRYLPVAVQGAGTGFGGAAGARIVVPAGLALSLGAGVDVVTSSIGPSVLPQLRVSIGWGF